MNARLRQEPIVWLALALLAWSPAAVATESAVNLTGEFIQGALIVGQTRPGATVELDGRPVRVAPDGQFVFGFGRDAEAQAVLEIRSPDGAKEVTELTVAARSYDVQIIEGLPDAQVTPPAEAGPRIAAEVARVAQARARDSGKPWFRAGFITPAEGPLTGVFGSGRVLNGQPRQPHFGIDIAAPLGAPVRAASAGQITLADRDLYYTGGTIIIDHGYGLSSTYSHLDQVLVAQGAVIGTVGQTGQASGAHLDWRVNWFEVRLDPELALSAALNPGPAK
jgi:murein DD-endopeptidase MepM/ murein hydrolase activator NlpD